MRKPPTRKPRTFKPVTMWAVVNPDPGVQRIQELFETSRDATQWLADRRFEFSTNWRNAYVCRVVISPAPVKRKVKR